MTEIKRIITVGCSITYGFGLNDIVDDEGNPYNTELGPSKLSWTNILASKLNLDLVNISIPGASSKWMAQEIINYPVSKHDIVIFLWPTPGRTCFKDDNEKYYHLVQTGKISIVFDQCITHSILDSSPYLEMQAKYGSVLDTAEKSIVWASAANKVVEQYTDNIFNFVYTNAYNNIAESYKVKLLHDFNPIIESNERVVFDHPGETAHKLIAEEMYKIIENNI